MCGAIVWDMAQRRKAGKVENMNEVSQVFEHQLVMEPQTLNKLSIAYSICLLDVTNMVLCETYYHDEVYPLLSSVDSANFS